MFSIQDLEQYDELLLFINAKNTDKRRSSALLLKNNYVLKNNMLDFTERLSPPSIMAGLGYLEHLKILHEMPAFWRDIECIVKATQGGHLHIVMYLMNRELSINHAYTTLLAAAEGGHLEVFNVLLANPLFEARVNTEVFKRAVDGENEQIVNQLLHYPMLLAFADQNETEYGTPYLRPFITKKVTYLLTEKPRDLTRKAATMYFYILRHLIRRAVSSDLPDIDFLLSMPPIRVMAHMDVSQDLPNELLRVAISSGNVEVEKRLLTISAVRDHAEQNNYYGHDEAKLRQIQRDKEERTQITKALFCLFRSIYFSNTAQSAAQIKTINRLKLVFCEDICKKILSYMLPNPFKKPSIEHQFYDDRFLFFNNNNTQKKEDEVNQPTVSSLPSTAVISNYDH